MNTKVLLLALLAALAARAQEEGGADDGASQFPPEGQEDGLNADDTTSTATTGQFQEFEGDILASADQIDALYGPAQLGAAGAAMRDVTKRWPGGVLSYQLDSSLDTTRRNNIAAAMKAWTDRTCVSFRPATSGDRVIFRASTGCSSYVGRVGGAQYINLASGCKVPQITHEIGHALGFWHEQSRPDRDTYVTVHPENIEAGKEHNFNKMTTTQIDERGEPYDYKSLMHYGSTFFSKNGKATITAKNGATLRGDSLSTTDVRGMNKLYGCFVEKGAYYSPASTTPGCPSGYEKDGLLCYPNCRSGYDGVGPVCWEICGATGYANHGLTCYKSFFNWHFKKSYGRGVGSLPGCPSSHPKVHLGKCYQNCVVGYRHTVYWFTLRCSQY
eukprot:m.232707 g.232707  ORF g.232707 m.232707 type:complete len:386 (+) comp22447_c0_seq3:251-1408(+)